MNPPRMLDQKVLEVEFSLALVRFLRHFNLVELNLGAAISHLKNAKDPKTTYPSLANMSLEKKLGEFGTLVRNRVEMSDEDASMLNAWIELGHTARETRNLYIHGYWDLLPMRIEKPLSLHAPPWMRDKLGMASDRMMSIEELAAIGDSMESLLQQLNTLRRKLGV